MKNILSFLSLFFFLTNPFLSQSQIQSLRFDEPGSLTVNGIEIQKKQAVPFPSGVPLFSLLIDSIFIIPIPERPSLGKTRSLLCWPTVSGGL